MIFFTPCSDFLVVRFQDTATGTNVAGDTEAVPARPLSRQLPAGTASHLLPKNAVLPVRVPKGDKIRTRLRLQNLL
jgi:hypothetical protein